MSARLAARLLGLAIVMAMVLAAAHGAGWYDRASCGEWLAMVQRVEQMTDEQRRALPDIMPAGEGHRRARALALSALHWVTGGATFGDAVGVCDALDQEEST